MTTKQQILLEPSATLRSLRDDIESYLWQAFVHRIRHAAKSKECVVGEVFCLSIDEHGPHARKLGEILLLIENIGDALNGVKVFGVSR